MKKEYLVQHVREITEDTWLSIKPLNIGIYPWASNGYTPMTTAYIVYTDESLHVRFDAEDEHIRAVNTVPNGPICQDSCVEFFVNPAPGMTGKYFNFEVNPLGVLHLAVGEGRQGRKMIEGDEHRMIRILPRIDSPVWRIGLTIPFGFFRSALGPIDFAPGHVMAANLYKCGDLSRIPHHGSWSPVGTQSPDFHRPEYFGRLVLGQRD